MLHEKFFWIINVVIAENDNAIEIPHLSQENVN